MIARKNPTCSCLRWTHTGLIRMQIVPTLRYAQCTTAFRSLTEHFRSCVQHHPIWIMYQSLSQWFVPQAINPFCECSCFCFLLSLPFKNQSHMITCECVCVFFLCVNWPINRSITLNGRVFDVSIFGLEVSLLSLVQLHHIGNQRCFFPYSCCSIDRCKWVSFNFSALMLINAFCTPIGTLDQQINICYQDDDKCAFVE